MRNEAPHLAPCLHLRFFPAGARLRPDDLARVARAVRAAPGLVRALAFTPLATSPDQPFAADGPGPALALQLDFAADAALDASASDPGPLAELLAPARFPPSALRKSTHSG